MNINIVYVVLYLFIAVCVYGYLEYKDEIEKRWKTITNEEFAIFWIIALVVFVSCFPFKASSKLSRRFARNKKQNIKSSSDAICEYKSSKIHEDYPV